MVKINPADLLDSRDVSELLELGSHRAVSTYRGRYEDFLESAVAKGAGRCLWLHADVEAWASARRT